MIDNHMIEEALGIKVEKKINCQELGYISDDSMELMSFMDDEKFVDTANRNVNINALFVTRDLSERIKNEMINKIIVDDPRYCFFELCNYVNKKRYVRTKTRIAPTAEIHSSAYIADYNVIIGKNVIVNPNVTIYPDVEIGDNTIIGASAVLGQQGFEYKSTKKGLLSVFHIGKVVIGNNVEIRANSCIDKGLFVHRNTIIGDNTKVNTLVMIGHGVQIGEGCFIHTSASISGSSKIGDHVWISPNAAITNGTIIGSNAFIGIGAVVIRAVQSGAVMVGNPARMIRKNK